MASPEDDRYRMEAVPRGICLIINNRNFKKDATKPQSKALKERKGTDIDRDSLKKVFEDMLFDVRCHDNLTDKKMVKTLNRAAEEDHRKSDCFVCCILSYGAPGLVYGTNGMPVKLLSLTATVKKKNSPSLSGKPKLFFIQACPVDDPSLQEIDHDDDVDAHATGITGASVGPAATGIKQSTEGISSDDQQDTKVLPKEADFLLSFCATSGIATAKNPAKGSNFVHALTIALKKQAAKVDIVDILTKMNQDQADSAPTPKHSLAKFLRLGPCPKLKDIRLMVVGKSKRGKSSVANTILGEDKFSVNNTFSQNLYSDWHQVTRDGRTIEITEMPTELDSDEAARPLITTTPGPHVIVLCFRCEQFFSPEDYFSYSTLKKWLGSHCNKYIILAFSGIDNITRGNIDEQVRNSYMSILRELPSPDRYICFNNTADWASRREQGEKLLRLVDRVAHDNGGGHFSNRRIRKFEEEIQYQLGRGRKRDEVKKRVVAGDDIELIFEKTCCVIS